MGHFRVELHTVETLLFVRHDGKRTGFGAGNGYEVSRDSGDFIAVAHPDIQQRFTGRADRIFDIANQSAWRGHFNLRITELAFV